MEKTIQKEDEESMMINNLTAERVKNKMELSYRRFKELYEAKNIDIDKLEDKITKLSEKLIALKEERANLENEVSGIYDSYLEYCQDTGLTPLSGI
jgi:DNA-directed RNA polymerase alpha subunit